MLYCLACAWWITLDGLSVQILSAFFNCGVDLRAIRLQQLLVGVKMPNVETQSFGWVCEFSEFRLSHSKIISLCGMGYLKFLLLISELQEWSYPLGCLCFWFSFVGDILSLTFVRWVVLKQDHCCCLNPSGVYWFMGPFAWRYCVPCLLSCSICWDSIIQLGCHFCFRFGLGTGMIWFSSAPPLP